MNEICINVCRLTAHLQDLEPLNKGVFHILSRIPQDDGECAVKQRLMDIPLPIDPPFNSTPPLKLTHDPLPSGPLPFIVHLDNYAASTDIQTNTRIRSAKVQHMMLMLRGRTLHVPARVKEPSIAVCFAAPLYYIVK